MDDVSGDGKIPVVRVRCKSAKTAKRASISFPPISRQRSSVGGFALANGPTMTWNKLIAWCVHGYTALGLVAAGGIAVAILYGTPASFRLAFALMLLATVIDATDGTLARHFRVKEVLPGFDGRRLDDLIDIHTYTSLPLLLVWKAQLL